MGSDNDRKQHLWLIENHTGLSTWWVEHFVVRARSWSEAWLMVFFCWFLCGWLRILIGCWRRSGSGGGGGGRGRCRGRGCCLFFRSGLRRHWLHLHFLNYSRLLRHWGCKRDQNRWEKERHANNTD